MAVYVDNMRARFGRMVMSHMIADTDDELLAMADKIGVARRWHQCPGTYKSHFDISLSKRSLAILAGAVQISAAEMGRKILSRRNRASAANTTGCALGE